MAYQLSQLDDIYPLLKTELFGVHAIQRSNYWFRNVLWPQVCRRSKFKGIYLHTGDVLFNAGWCIRQL